MRRPRRRAKPPAGLTAYSTLPVSPLRAAEPGRGDVADPAFAFQPVLVELADEALREKATQFVRDARARLEAASRFQTATPARKKGLPPPADGNVLFAAAEVEVVCGGQRRCGACQ